MKISFNWLGDHIDIDDLRATPQELTRRLTDAGLEVEAVEDQAAQFRAVVVGQITKLERHPNADRLTVCQVDVGAGELRQIVCGAKNHRAGDKVVTCLVGAVLPGNFEIRKSKIRDVESLGMLASESELGLKKQSEGILILPPDAPVGRSFAEYRGLDDIVFDIKVTPNRADCLSHLGLARELSCLLDRPLKVNHTSLDAGASRTRVDVTVDEPKICPRYAGRVIERIKVARSPEWLVRRLESVGMNSINNVVDVTNFVMMDLGQPLHAFDADQLGGGQLRVALGREGESFTALDGTAYTLSGDELTIRDGGGRAVCLAGVVGGANSGVSATTESVFLESAQFAMDRVRKTSRRFGLQTDSAYRFSRGTDIGGVRRALERASALIVEVAGGVAGAEVTDIFPNPVSRPDIRLDPAYVSERLGYPVPVEPLKHTLTRLGCEVAERADHLLVRPPEFRLDLEQDVDLVEEFGRLNGYDRIPATLPPLTHAPLADDKQYIFESRVASRARAAGLSRAVNFGFTNARTQAEWLGRAEAYRAAGLEMDSEPVALRNPLSEDLNVMRLSLVPGLLKNVLHNVRHGMSEGRLFETGFTFGRGPDGYRQHARLALAAWGQHEGLWQKRGDEALVLFDLKARLQQILEQLLIAQVQFKPWAEAPTLLHPAQSATIFCEGRNLGFIGVVHPELGAREKLRGSVALAELDLAALGRGQPRTVKFKPVAKFPAVERDLAFVQPKSLKAQDVLDEIKRSAGALLQSIEIFDVFRGGSLGEDEVSVAYRMVYQDAKETLTDERLGQLQSLIVQNVSKKLGARVR